MQYFRKNCLVIQLYTSWISTKKTYLYLNNFKYENVSHNKQKVSRQQGDHNIDCKVMNQQEIIFLHFVSHSEGKQFSKEA